MNYLLGKHHNDIYLKHITILICTYLLVKIYRRDALPVNKHM